MNYENVPIIVLCCYMIGEVYKLIFKENTYKVIPILLTFIGGVLGGIIFLFDKDELFNSTSIIKAITIGMISGASSTGANQIIKQIFKKEEEKNEQILQ